MFNILFLNFTQIQKTDNCREGLEQGGRGGLKGVNGGKGDIWNSLNNKVFFKDRYCHAYFLGVITMV